MSKRSHDLKECMIAIIKLLSYWQSVVAFLKKMRNLC